MPPLHFLYIIKTVIDISGRSEGRGFYLCKSEECIRTAVKRKAFNRVCKRNLDEEEISRLTGQLSGIYQGGIDVKEGDVDIEFSYIPKGLISGILLSALSLSHTPRHSRVEVLHPDREIHLYL